MKVTRKQNNSEYCLICGVLNPAGLKAPFYETENNSVVTKFQFKKEHQSYPGRTHGGMIGALLDELVGRAIWITQPDMWGVTMTLTIKYRKPVPYDTTLIGEGRIVSETTRTFSGTGEIKDLSGNILASAQASYMKLPLSKIADTGDHTATDIFVPDNVTEI